MIQVERLQEWLRVRRRGMAAAAMGLVVVPCLAQSGDGPRQSYFEFGTVVELGTRTVEVQAFDARTNKIVQHSFLRTRETHSDPLKIGDQVEVIFTASGGEWTARRLVALPGGFPSAGPAPVGAPASAPVVAGNAAASTTSASRAKNRGALPPAPIVRAVPPPSAVALGTKSVPKVAAVTQVPLGISAGYSTPAPVPVTKTVAREAPSAACHQGGLGLGKGAAADCSAGLQVSDGT